MSNSYVLLEKVVVPAAGASSVTFANIPQTGYTDLVVKFSVRSTTNVAGSGYFFFVRPNGSTTNQTYRALYTNGSSASSFSGTTLFADMNPSDYTASTFGNGEIYIPNYTSVNNKSMSTDVVTENNATNVTSGMYAGLWSNTSAITSLDFVPGGGNFAANSTFYLYGVAKLGTTPTIAPKATGGDVIDTDGTYWYHIFRSSGTFTPAVALTCDYLVVAGGAGAGSRNGGGGGAGGYLTGTLGVSTAQTVTIGAGGAGATSSAGANGGLGTDSTFATITSTRGGSGGGENAAGATGGSGGGGGANAAAGAGTSLQGNAGGAGASGTGGGGGGAGATGGAGNPTGFVGGAGGNGTASSITGTSVTRAGGGGGGALTTGGSAGTGGGGAGGGGANNGVAGTANTGGGGGGGGASGGTGYAGGNGGSGIVVVRYLVA